MKMHLTVKKVTLSIIALVIVLVSCVNIRDAKRNPQLQQQSIEQATLKNHYSGYLGQSERFADRLLRRGKKVFRYDTFGDEQFWSDSLGLHLTVAGAKYGGVGPGLTPMQALELGLKVDRRKLTAPVAFATKLGLVPLDKNFITMLLLKMNAVVGVKAKFKGPLSFKIKTLGITCASCHSTTDNSIGPGIGRRLDGWPNRDLDVGKIVAFSHDLSPIARAQGTSIEEVKKVLLAWGPGKYDAEYNQDGIGFRPDGKTAATLIPAAFAMAGQNLHTWNGWGNTTHWNAYVAVTQLHGKGVFYEPRMNDEKKYPLAVKNNHWNVRSDTDMVTSKLGALQAYQISLPAPKAPKRLYDQQAADRGQALFITKAKCASCHVPPLFTEPGHQMHRAEEIGVDDFQARRSPDGGSYKTMSLRGLFARTKGGFYHDGRFKDLTEVVQHYNNHFKLQLSDQEINDIKEYLKSL